MTVLLILLAWLLCAALLIRVVWPGEAPPVTDEDWEEWQAYLREIRERRAH